MQNLNIHLCTSPDGDLIARQESSSKNILRALDVETLKNLISVEFLLDANGAFLSTTRVIKQNIYDEVFMGDDTIIEFPNDGTFTYYKFIVPALSYFLDRYESIEKDNKKYPKYNISSGSIFYYNGSLYMYENNLPEDEEPSLDVILKHSIDKSYEDLIKYEDISLLTFQKVVFSFCNLQKCLLNLQSQILKNPNNCNGCGKLNGNNLVKYNRDFLLNAIFLLHYFVKIEEFEKAQFIIDSLEDCSGQICGDKSKSNCNCG